MSKTRLTTSMKRISAAIGLGLWAHCATASSWTLETDSSRMNQIEAQLNNQNSHLSSDLRRQKYDKMAASPFTFYRGTAHLYYYDLTQKNLISLSEFSRSDAVTWIQGDLHVQNYGAFDNDDGDVVFDLNDFDEAWVACYLYDLWRASVSLALVAEENNGFNNADKADFIDAFIEEYLDRLETYRGNNNEKNAQLVENNTYGRLDNFLADVEANESRSKMLDKWTNIVGGKRKFDLSYSKLGSVSSNEWNTIAYAIDRYKDNLTSKLNGNNNYFTVKDTAERLDAGTGSLGTSRFYVLIEGPTSSNNDDRILDVKQQSLPSVYSYLSNYEKQNVLYEYNTNQQGCRVAYAQRALLTGVDDHLGCVNLFNANYSVRERSPYKESFDTAELTSNTRFEKLAEQWGWILAIDHARADNDFDATLVPYSFEDVMHDIADGYHSELRAEAKDFALAYAAQVEIDYQLFLQLRALGRIE